MCNAHYATEYSSWSDMLIFGKGKKSAGHPDHGMEQTPLLEWLRRYSLQPMKRGLSDSFFFCVSITLFQFCALRHGSTQIGCAQSSNRNSDFKKNAQKRNSRPPALHTSIPPHHSHLTFCVASNSYDNILASRAPSPPPYTPSPSSLRFARLTLHIRYWGKDYR